MNTNYTNFLLMEQKLIEMEEILENLINPRVTSHCGHCGAPITDWEDVEFTGKEVILTHKCECGRYAELHHRVVFDKVNVIEEGN